VKELENFVPDVEFDEVPDDELEDLNTD